MNDLRLQCILILLFAVCGRGGQTLQAADPPKIKRRIPPPGIAIPDDAARDLKRQLEKVQNDLQTLQHALRPDAAVLAKAVAWALRHGEFYKPKRDVAAASQMLKQATARAAALRKNESPWTRKTGRLIRGYVSAVDGSLQPYGLEIPAGFDFQKPAPLYVWLHGRGDKITDLHFIKRIQDRAGRIRPPGAIVLHPFGRHCMGFKSAGEVDVLDAIAHVRSQYRIDPQRIALMGFSMGGAGAWHVGAHYADRWVALSPGAGFAETAEYNRLKPGNYPPWYEQKLWGLYDVPGYVRNLFNLPVVAYSGEKDKQIQAARVMERAFQKEGRRLTHLIGPGMGHRYHPKTLAELMRRISVAVEAGRDPHPNVVHLQTQTLRYHRMHWVEALRLEQHWSDARIDARRDSQAAKIDVQTKNIRTLRLTPPGAPPKTVRIDGQALAVDRSAGTDGSLTFVRDEGRWRPHGMRHESSRPEKQPGLQGPIDDVFLEPFLVVAPGKPAAHPAVEKWTAFELSHFIARWRALYRGEPRVKKDREVTAEDLQRYHLVLFGDPTSNSWIRRILAAKTGPPLRWDREALSVGKRRFDSRAHAPVLVYPNPLQRGKYVVFNSGPTHREAHDRTNSLQNPKLPDWAVIDLRVPPSAAAPGKIADADFFDERWELRPPRSVRKKR